MEGTNEDDDMSSNAHSAGSKLLRGGEGDWIDKRLFVGR